MRDAAFRFTPPLRSAPPRLPELIAAAQSADGAAPFSDQSLAAFAQGCAVLVAASATDALPDAADALLGAALLVPGQPEPGQPVLLELVVHPQFRGRGVGGALLRETLRHVPAGTPIHAWAQGSTDAAAAVLARRSGFRANRTLFLMERALDDLRHTAARSEAQVRAAQVRAAQVRAAQVRAALAPNYRIDEFREADIDDWVALNARIFADHPEQGRLVREDVLHRMHEPWFRADDAFLARDATGELAGYVWCKVPQPAPCAAQRDGEIYVIGVGAHHAGRGLGTALMHIGLARLAQRDCSHAVLYVDGENTPAMRLYSGLLFTPRTHRLHYTNSPAQQPPGAQALPKPGKLEL